MFESIKIDLIVWIQNSNKKQTIMSIRFDFVVSFKPHFETTYGWQYWENINTQLDFWNAWELSMFENMMFGIFKSFYSRLNSDSWECFGQVFTKPALWVGFCREKNSGHLVQQVQRCKNTFFTLQNRSQFSITQTDFW